MQMRISAGLIALVVVWGLVSPATLDATFNAMLAIVTRNFGWLYLWIMLALIVLALVLAVSRYGDLKLGADDDEPEFSLSSWFSMLFSAGMGIGLVYWGVAEPLSHFTSSPPDVIAGTPDAANTAMRYAFFHWGCILGPFTALWDFASPTFNFGATASRSSVRPLKHCPGARRAHSRPPSTSWL